MAEIDSLPERDQLASAISSVNCDQVTRQQDPSVGYAGACTLSCEHAIQDPDTSAESNGGVGQVTSDGRDGFSPGRQQLESVIRPPNNKVWVPTYDWIVSRFPFLSKRSLQELNRSGRNLFGMPLPRSYRIGKVRASTEAELERWYAGIIQSLARQHEDQARKPPTR